MVSLVTQEVQFHWNNGGQCLTGEWVQERKKGEEKLEAVSLDNLRTFPSKGPKGWDLVLM